MGINYQFQKRPHLKLMAKNRTRCCCCCRGLRRPPPHRPIGWFLLIILKFHTDSFISNFFFFSSPTSQSFLIPPSFKFVFFLLTVLSVGFLIVPHIIILYIFSSMPHCSLSETASVLTSPSWIFFQVWLNIFIYIFKTIFYIYRWVLLGWGQLTRGA